NVPGKSYFVFKYPATGRTSRPVNEALFENNLKADKFSALLLADRAGLAADEISRIIYTAAAAYCCATDVTKVSDQKTPGTFFEIFIGHLVARAFGVNPKKRIVVPTLDAQVELPTDFHFELGPGKNRVHLPVKLSTRERVVQVWAHQRVLDGMHGVNRFK